MHTAFHTLVALLLTAAPLWSQPSFTLEGTISDSATGEAIIAANIRVLGTSRGTISNLQGKYILPLPQGEYRIVCSYLAYQPETLLIHLSTNLKRDFILRPSPVKLPEVLVYAEDPALEIIRRAIANKRKWMDKLHSYKFEAFTREVLRRDTAIASITESYTTGWMIAGDTLREVIKQKRQTQNIPSEENLASVGRILNFNEDEIRLFRITIDGSSSSYTFVGPTAPDALDYYDYKLLNTSLTNGVAIFSIRMSPKSRLRPLFDGTITIADGTFAVMGVDVQPNEAMTLPFVKEMHLRYRQKFALFDEIFWLPTDIRIDGSIRAGIVGISLPRIGIEQTSAIYDCATNVDVPDSVRHATRLRVDSSALTFDSTFWKQNVVLPMTAQEESAYATLDSTQTLEKQLSPEGPLSTLAGKGAESLFKYADVRFNRVEGFFLGADASISPLRDASVRASAGTGLSDRRLKFSAGGTLFAPGFHTLSAGADIYDEITNVPDAGYYGPLIISVMALVDKNDYRDYYYTKGWTAFLNVSPKRWANLEAAYIAEHQYSSRAMTDYVFFPRAEPYRVNPAIREGELRAMRFRLRLGSEPEMLELVSRNAFEFSALVSPSGFANNEFDFTRYEASIQWNIRTFAKSLLFSPVLRVKASAGTSGHDLPPQYVFTLDSRSTGYAPNGVLRGAGVKEFTGDRYVMLNVEHNFRSVPFLGLNIPFLYRNNIELITHASFAQAWYGTTSATAGWYSEAGLGLSRLLDLLRFDVTYRFKDPSRWYFTFSLATFL